jgi:branched-chain amino acid transport system permease protein
LIRLILTFVPAVLVALALPMLVSDFWSFVLIQVMAFALYAVSFNLLFGYAGMLAFGHAVFFGVGAYALAILMKRLSCPPLLALACAPFVAAAWGGLIGLFCIRLTGIYLGMLTFAFQMLTYTIVFKSYDLTGGDDGLSGLTIAGPIGAPHGLYYLVLSVTLVALLILRTIIMAPFGLSLRALRGNDRKALSLGINVALHRWLAFVTAAFFAGLAGALAALASRSVFPGWLDWSASATPIVMTILGGTQSFFGPIIGAALYVLAQTFLAGQTEYWAFWLGLVIIVVVLAMPNGIVGLVKARARE